MSDSSIVNTMRAIEEAFAGVSLGDGISLREADVIDDYGSESERAAARAQDEIHDWRNIPDEFIEKFPDVLCFMDDAGLRFHLPAYMRFALLRYEDSDSRSTDSAVFRLCDPSSIEQLRGFLAPAQINAILQFLLECQQNDRMGFSASDIGLAIRQWNGDETAARESKEIAARRDQWFEEFGTLATDLGIDWLTLYRNGELDAEAEKRVTDLLRKLGGDPGA
ncbi:hypothetical protein GC170_13590 [bacterium]|nr:hypothetical protein [bacterium]